MRNSWCIVILTAVVMSVVMSCKCFGMQSSYNQGTALSQQRPPPPPSDPSGIVPEYKGAHVPQAQYSAHDLDAVSTGTSQVTDNEAGRFVVQSSQERERFTIDPKTDPMISQANDIVINPQKALNENITAHNISGPSQEETYVCEESGEETIETGEEFREVTVTQPPIAQHKVQLYNAPTNYLPLNRHLTCNVIIGAMSLSDSSHPNYLQLLNPLPPHLRSHVIRVERDNAFSCQGQSHYFSAPFSDGVTHCQNRLQLALKRFSTCTPDGIFSFKPMFFFGHWWLFQRHDILLTFTIFYRAPITEEHIKERIDHNCQSLEERVDQGLCFYEDLIVLEGPQTRVINGHPVTRDWWRRKRVYRCHYPCKDNCGPLRAKGCYQSKSTCKQKVGETCVVWEQTYKCPAGQIGGRSYRSSNLSSPFCLSGNCASQLYDANGDFASVMAQLSVLQGVQKDMRDKLPIFKGEDKRCSRDCLGFRDCCGSGKGWGVSVKFASCGAEEKKLAKLREKGRCIQVGTYCAKKVLGQCVSRKTSFCCYKNKLARLIQEQGRSQLGLSFGCPKEPRCEGLTIEQLAQLDFSKINFSELFGELMAKTTVPQGQKLTQDIQQTMSDRASLMNVKEGGGQLPTNKESLVKTNTVQGRGHGQF